MRWLRYSHMAERLIEMKAYLAWPVKIKGCGIDEEMHLTLKYIGALDNLVSGSYTEDQVPGIVADNIADLIAGLDTNLDLCHCVAQRQTRLNKYTEAIILLTVPVIVAALRAAVDDLAPNDYGYWQPHLTFPKGFPDTRHIVRDHTLAELAHSYGPLTLYVDKKPYRTY